VELGLRWDHWFAKSFIRGAGGTFDPAIGKAVAGLDSAGQVDLTAQPVAPYLAAATAGFGCRRRKYTFPAACSNPPAMFPRG